MKALRRDVYKRQGGDPAVIPQLTYEKFIAFHRNYYHPANSYIYLYGDMDMAQKLTWLDQEYLGQYDREDCHADSAKMCIRDRYQCHPPRIHHVRAYGGKDV